MAGNWILEDFKNVNLPQKVASGFAEVTGGLVGADYMPVLYVGHQVVNGMNYCVLATQVITNANPETRLVKMVINEAPDGVFSLVSVSGIAL